ncbi:MAG: hypothetical protein AAF108_02595 [Planctomycetota bacterium]
MSFFSQSDAPTLAVPAGWLGVAVSLLYVATDAGELATGGAFREQLVATYIALLGMPFAVLGLHAAGVGGGTLRSLIGAVGYAASFAVFSGVTLVAVVEGATDYGTLARRLSPLYEVSGAVMALGGAVFADAIRRARIAPRWTAWLLLAGSAVSIPIALLPIDPNWQILANTLRNVAGVGLGCTLIATKSNSARMR